MRLSEGFLPQNFMIFIKYRAKMQTWRFLIDNCPEKPVKTFFVGIKPENIVVAAVSDDFYCVLAVRAQNSYAVF